MAFDTGSVTMSHIPLPLQGAWLGGRLSRLSGLVSKAVSAENCTDLSRVRQCPLYEVCSMLRTTTELSLSVSAAPTASDANGTSCACTAGEWRGKKELLGTLEAAIPYTERGAGGADIWPLQLRDNWTRHVPLGNMFSGLFMEIKEKTQAEKAA